MAFPAGFLAGSLLPVDGPRTEDQGVRASS